MIGQTISHYKIIEKLGEGGMGVVYKAQDVKLDRFVVLKFLAPYLTRDEQAKERFINEAKAASALDHPNICTIYEINETDDGQMFMAMAYYEGETLREQVSSGQLAVNGAIGIATQIAQGLARAHEAGIVHRDIKPANIIINKRNEVKILDFGLAKLAGQGHITKTGSTMGTAAYMSPEQAQGMEVDHRTDIWSLGVILYEMLTGQLPFKGKYEQAMLYAIVNTDPAPAASSQNGISVKLEQIINNCLAKDILSRYQHVNDLLMDLQRFHQDDDFKQSLFKRKAWPTAKKRRMVTWTGLTLALIISIIAGYRFFHRTAEPRQRIPIAVADFSNATGEKELDGLSGMLITSLEQSRRLSVLTRSHMLDILKQMGKENVERIDEALGREICQHANVRAMVIASVQKFGRQYAIELKVLDPLKNEYLFGVIKKGEGQESLLALLDEVSEEVRAGLKEQATQIEAATAKVAEVTTTSFEAYQHYFLGEQFLHKLDFQNALKEFEAAIKLDSTFVLAQYRLSYTIGQISEEASKLKSVAKKAMENAIKYIHTAPAKEQYLIRAWKARSDDENEKAFTLYQQALRLYPDEKEILFDAGDLIFHHINDLPAAIEYFDKVLIIDPTFEMALQHNITACHRTAQYSRAINYAERFVARKPSEEAYKELGASYYLNADFDKAFALYQRALELFPHSAMPIVGLGNYFLFQNDYQKAEAEFRKLLEPFRPPAMKRIGYRHLASLYAHLGQYREVDSIYEAILTLDRDSRNENYLFRDYAEWAWWRIAGKNDLQQAEALVRRSFKLQGSPDSWYTLTLFRVYLLAGDFEKSSFHLSQALRQGENLHPYRDILFEAYRYRAKGEYQNAIAKLLDWKSKRHIYDGIFALYPLAECYLEAGDTDKAIETTRQMQNTYVDGVAIEPNFRGAIYPKGFYLLGKSYEKQGNKELAIENYEKLLALWKNADKDLPELIDAKARLAKLK